MKKPGKKLPGERLKKIEKTRKQLLAHKFALSASPSKSLMAALDFDGVTHWEERTCVGYNPELAQLEAVVQIKRQNGYSGGLCTDGSGFTDVGRTSFNADDISDAPPGPQNPISHMVFQALDESGRRDGCDNPVLPKIRAVLGWSEIPSLDPCGYALTLWGYDRAIVNSNSGSQHRAFKAVGFSVV